MQWARAQPWGRIGAVVIVGWVPEAIEIVRQARPAADIVVFDPDNTGEDGEGYYRVELLDSVRNKIGQRKFPHWEIAMLCPPEMQEQWAEPAQQAVIDGEQFARCRHMTMLTNVEKWTDIGLELLPDLVGTTPLQELEGIAAGRDGLIVGAGPSLSQAMFWLPTIQDRLVIAATEAALPVLERGGVRPDIVVAVESQAAAYDGLADLSLWSDAILIPGIHAHPRVWSMPAKQICPAIQAIGPVGHWLVENTGATLLDSGGSVSTVAYSVLHHLGVDTICGIGIDSAYGPRESMQAYAQGVVGKNKPPTCSEVLPAWGGTGEVASSPQLKTYRDWFAVMARKHVDRIHVNLSVGGARISGWHEMELCDWVEAVKDRCDVAGALEVPDKPLDLHWTIASLEEQLDGIVYAEEQARTAIAATNRMVEAITALGKLPRNHNTRLVAGLQMSPLEQMAMLPGPHEMQAAIAVNEQFIDRLARFGPKLERALERMKQRYARAA